MQFWQLAIPHYNVLTGSGDSFYNYEGHDNYDNDDPGPSNDDYSRNHDTNNSGNDTTIAAATECKNNDKCYHYIQPGPGEEHPNDQHEVAHEDDCPNHVHERVYHPTLNGA